MDLFTARDLGRACRIFLELAYPAGSALIPADVRPYAEIGADGAVTDYLAPAPLSLRVCQKLIPEKDGATGFAFRLGRHGYRHLKLRVQQMEHRCHEVWVFSVETHDRFLIANDKQSASEMELLKDLKKTNEQLKAAIEKAFAKADLLTPTELLRIDLTAES